MEWGQRSCDLFINLTMNLINIQGNWVLSLIFDQVSSLGLEVQCIR